MTTEDAQKRQRQLALERLKVREEMRSVDLEETSSVIEQKALERVRVADQPPAQATGLMSTVLELIRQVPPAHKVVVIFPVVVFILYLIGWQLGMW